MGTVWNSAKGKADPAPGEGKPGGEPQGAAEVSTEELCGIQQGEKQILHQERKNPRNLTRLQGEQDLHGPSSPGVILSVNKLVFWAAQRRREAKTGAEITSPSCQVAASPSCCTCSRAELLAQQPQGRKDTLLALCQAGNPIQTLPGQGKGIVLTST